MTLTPRQMQIAQLVGQGLSYKAVARETGIAIQTVKNHVQAAANALPGIGSPRYKLIAYSIRNEQQREAA